MTGDDSMNPPPDARMKHELEGAQDKLFAMRASQGPNKMLNDPQNYTSRRISNAAQNMPTYQAHFDTHR